MTGRKKACADYKSFHQAGKSVVDNQFLFYLAAYDADSFCG